MCCVLLLRPVDPRRPVMVLPAVDPVAEPGGASGVAAALIFPVHLGHVQEFARDVQAGLAPSEAAGFVTRGCCIRSTLNNFPQLPIRTDGPFVVGLGVMHDERVLQNRFLPLERRVEGWLEQSPFLNGPPEPVILTATRRSRLRWKTS